MVHKLTFESSSARNGSVPNMSRRLSTSRTQCLCIRDLTDLSKRTSIGKLYKPGKSPTVAVILSFWDTSFFSMVEAGNELAKDG